MRIAALLIFACVSCSPVPIQAFEIKGNTITLTDAELAGCVAEGGCSLISHRLRLEIIAALTQLSADLEAKICRRMGT
jgi:hypothetical protein